MAATKAYGIAGPNPVQIRTYPVKSSAVFAQGDFVLLTSTGIDKCAAASASFANPTSNAVRIVGRALAGSTDYNASQGSSGVQATSVAVELATTGVWFQMPLYSATPASAVPTISQIGTKYGFYQTSGGYPSVNIDDTTNVCGMITDFDENDFSAWPGSYGPGTTQYANVYVEVLSSAALCSGAR